jgi:hypothetical protein
MTASLLIKPEGYISNDDETTCLGKMLAQVSKPQVRLSIEYASTQDQLSPVIQAENELVEAAHVGGEMTATPAEHKGLEIRRENGFHESGEDMEICKHLLPSHGEEGKEFLSQSLPTLNDDSVSHSPSESLIDSTCSQDGTDWEESDDDDGFPIQLRLLGKELLYSSEY